jgi:hypothetical protein
MIKAEPKTILHFLWNYFDVVRDLFEIQSNEGIIRKESFALICNTHHADIQQKLLDYKVVKVRGNDFEFRDVYYKLVEFLLFEFRPLLPEEIEKYGIAISELHRKIREGTTSEKNILLDRIKALSSQVGEFSESVEKNTIRLLSETRELKANKEKLDYREKILKASHWIHFYISPLNTILDVHHSESISNKLLQISEYTNQQRLSTSDEAVRLQFEKLYNQLVQVNDELLRQSKILINELLPLIERIKTESLIITGWIEFLKNPYKVNPPKVLKTERDNPYSNKIYLNTKEYFEQFKKNEDVFIEEEPVELKLWIFNKALFKAKLKEDLPLVDFFGWCEKALLDDNQQLSSEKFFSLTSLLFEEDVEVIVDEHQEVNKYQLGDSLIEVPILKVKKNAVS